MKRFLSFLTAWILLFSLAPAIHVHAQTHDHVTEVSKTEAGEVAVFEERGDAIPYICDMLRNRVPEFVIRLPVDQYYETMLERMYASALSHTNLSPSCGDSVRWQAVPGDCYLRIEEGYVYLYYAFSYLTTIQEEKTLDEAIAALLEELQCRKDNRYATVKTVYDWVCANVEYVDVENASLSDLSPYGALVNRSATGYGFALLLYRLYRELEIPCSVVPGTFRGELHAWNVVMVDGDYYNVDAALDAGEQAWFVKSDGEFTDHQRDPVCDEWHVPYADTVYQSPSDICLEIGHYWYKGATCMEPNYCNRCGELSGEYGEHRSLTSTDGCEDPFVCCYCGQLEIGKHVYSDDRDQYCDLCRHYRQIICQEDSWKLRYTVLMESDEPEFYGDPGVVFTLAEKQDSTNVYRVTFPEMGSYRIQVKWANGRETEIYDVLVANHEYRESDGVCIRCGKNSETVHYHTWIPRTCDTPETCTGCGETRGEPKPHYFYNKNCTKEPSVCEDCGYVTEGPPGHVYHSSYDSRCLKCDQQRIFGCTKAGAMWSWTSSFPDGYYLVEADPGVTLEIMKSWEDIGYYGWTYAVKTEGVGTFEVTLEDLGTGERTTITAEIKAHTYSEVDGICYYCQERDPDRHFHDWSSPTCTEPSTCSGCGATDGDPLGHHLTMDPCTGPKTCQRCGFIREAPSHFYGDEPNAVCTLCNQRRVTVCEGTGLSWLIGSSEGGDFTLDNPDSGCSLVLLEYFVAKGVHYWECIIYAPGPGLYELSMSQKDSEEPLGVTLQVVPHEFEDGVCLLCGGLEEGEHIHTWKSATCTKPAVCTECGESEGTKLNHDFSQFICTEYAQCARCGEKRGKGNHSYDSVSDDYCNVCNRFRVLGCQDDEIIIALENHESAGFRLSNAPSGVSIKEVGYFVGINIEHKYQIFTPSPGVYELTMKDKVTGEAVHFTVERLYHEYVDGRCENCGKKDKTVHFHQWSTATCEEAATCLGCGETKGEALGHMWQEATCTLTSYCHRCGIRQGETLGHDFLEWSCWEPAICRRCNIKEDHVAGHVYDDAGDESCNRCQMYRVLGCPDSVLTISLSSAVEDPYILVHPAKGISMDHRETVFSDGFYIQTYALSVSGSGEFEVTVWQEGMAEYEIFAVHVLDHLYENGLCRFCSAEFVGLPGDVDGNGTLNYNDALLILRASIGLATLSAEQQLLADFDGNGRADYNDALAILRKSIGL